MRRSQSREPTALSRLLSACCDDERGAAAVNRAVVQARWRQVAGDQVARHTAVVGTGDDGVVTIGVPSAAWGRRLERIHADLVAAFGQLPGGRPVRRLRFQQVDASALRGRVTPRRGRRDAAARGESAACPPLSDRQQAALQALGADAADLGPLFESWMRHTRRRRGE